VFRINLIRIAFGAVLLHRYGTNLWALAHLDTSPAQWLAIGFELSAALMLAVGFLAPLAALSLFLFQWHADQVLLSWSLSTMVVQMLCLVMAFLPAGTELSLDARLRWRWVTAIYRVWGSPTESRANLLRLMALTAYAVASLSAAQFHLQDRLWRSGEAQVLVFTNPYFSAHADAFRWVVARLPGAASVGSLVATLAMLAWEVLMLPLALWGSRFGRLAVCGYGLAFFVSSALLLHLAWLPYFELLLWALVFWGPPLKLQPPEGNRAGIGVFVFVAGCLLAVADYPVAGSVNPLPVLSEHLGISPVNVFNRTDLRTNESYAVLYRLEGGKETRLPLNDEKGGRLAWHASERIYYGVALMWRRERVGMGDRCWVEDIDRWRVETLVKFDRELGGNGKYAVAFYSDGRLVCRVTL